MKLRVTQVKESSVVVEGRGGRRDEYGNLPWMELSVADTDRVSVGDTAVLSIVFMRNDV